MPEAKATVIFIHVPKAAGTTLHRIIETAVSAVENIYHQWRKILSNPSRSSKKLSPSRKKKIKMLRGHMPFGLHALLPQNATYITILRHPVERIISHYYYVLRTPEHYLHADVAANKIDLENYVYRGISTELDNGQTRLLSGYLSGAVHNQDIDYGGCTREMLEKAKNNLSNHFSVVGLSEHFDESLLLMKQRLGWRSPYYVKHRVGFRPPPSKKSPEKNPGCNPIP